MFRNLPRCAPRDEDLKKLAATMIEPQRIHDPEEKRAEQRSRGHSRLFAGYTFFGQFIDHDLSFDPASTVQRINDPGALVNFRTPAFDLDCLYGGGPDLDPYFYEADDEGTIRFSYAPNKPTAGEVDLQRNKEQRALIADPRNDANFVVSQLHLEFLLYHNRVTKELRDRTNLCGKALFEAAQRTVRWHYQWALLTDFLPTVTDCRALVGPGRPAEDGVSQQPLIRQAGQPGKGHKVDGDGLPLLRISEQRSLPREGGVRECFVWRSNLKHFGWQNDVFMPVEFSGAAFRFGHSMVRDSYTLNSNERGIGVILFDSRTRDRKKANDLGGFRRRPAGMSIDWRRFFDCANDAKPQLARPIDPLLSHPLSTMPPDVAGGEGTEQRSLALRNLRRGVALGLPSGQSVARAMGMPEDLVIGGSPRNIPFHVTTEGVSTTAGDAEAMEKAFSDDTPLWYYLLLEADVFHRGERLGPVGSTLVTEVFIGLMCADPFSFLNAQPTWQPVEEQFGCRKSGYFGISELINAGVVPSGSV